MFRVKAGTVECKKNVNSKYYLKKTIMIKE